MQKSPSVSFQPFPLASSAEWSKEKLLPLFAAERTLEIGDEGVRSESAAGSQLVRWWFVESVDEADGHVAIFPAAGSIFLIPKAAVKPDVLKPFLSELRERLRPVAGR